MALKDALVAEMKHEAANTRKMLERIPTPSFQWKPHEKSYSLIRLAQHLANLPVWTRYTLLKDELDFDQPIERPRPVESTEELLVFFDKQLLQALEILDEADDVLLNTSWTMRKGEQVYFTLPKKIVLRSFVFNHIVHHRGQLSVYLRLLNIPVPGMYGPSADER